MQHEKLDLLKWWRPRFVCTNVVICASVRVLTHLQDSFLSVFFPERCSDTHPGPDTYPIPCCALLRKNNPIVARLLKIQNIRVFFFLLAILKNCLFTWMKNHCYHGLVRHCLNTFRKQEKKKRQWIQENIFIAYLISGKYYLKPQRFVSQRPKLCNQHVIYMWNSRATLSTMKLK